MASGNFSCWFGLVCFGLLGLIASAQQPEPYHGGDHDDDDD